MVSEHVIEHSRRKRRKRFLLIGVAVLVSVAVVAVVVGLIAAAKKSSTSLDSFKNVVMKRCETYLKENEHMSRENDCKIIWGAFEQAYIMRDPCDVPPEAYEPLINSIKQDVACNTMLFWSKTKIMAHAFTDKRDCLVTVEDTLLGYLFDDLTWCSKNESKETFTTDCPGWSDCQNNPVRSFWIQASTNFAATACGNVSVMLNGSVEAPFSPTSSVGGNDESQTMKKKYQKITKIKLGSPVVMVARDEWRTILDSNKTTLYLTRTACNHSSLHILQSALDTKITYNCRMVPYSKVEGCIYDLEIPCSDCL
ncbi:ADP-ribosyl cyclase/cyclic ADP-ribose hydrolase 1 isoform X2 [Neoarius graeffei]|uniref:ADP-ribosyl cyclase/cyclic ADP-ribose hydrolase 1 isoform X2 n=1 Tax=Neoarius graeffei TaxID=443677 RepID=UPI00298C34B4|nr:ADP-ribosyl cyclase/cyclic ADP-ribose hydrolase 1 isoform X2 [Neoarius graeffei]